MWVVGFVCLFVSLLSLLKQSFCFDCADITERQISSDCSKYDLVSGISVLLPWWMKQQSNSSKRSCFSPSKLSMSIAGQCSLMSLRITVLTWALLLFWIKFLPNPYLIVSIVTTHKQGLYTVDALFSNKLPFTIQPLTGMNLSLDVP